LLLTFISSGLILQHPVIQCLSVLDFHESDAPMRSWRRFLPVSWLGREKLPRAAQLRKRPLGYRTFLRAEQLEERVLLDCNLLPMFLGDRGRATMMAGCTQMAPPAVDFQFAATANLLPQTAGHTRQTSVTLLGHTSPGLRVVLQQTGQGTTANASGNFSFSNVPLVAGSNVIRVTATDSMGQTGSAQHSITRDVNNLAEGTAFTSIFQFAFTVPKQAATLQFSYDSLKFDPAGPFMPDAFEAALVDGQGNPLVLPIGGSHDAFFNITNGQSAALGANARLAGTTVRVDLAHIPAGTRATLVVRVVSNDFGNSGRGIAPTSVRLDDLEVLPGSLNTPIGTTLAERLTRQTVAGVDPSTLSDVTSSIHAAYGQTSYRPGGTLLFTDLTLRNTGTYPVDGPLVAVIEHLSDPTVHVENADGTTAQGQPYFLIDPAGQSLSPGQRTGSRQLEFLNPKQVRFHYDLVVLGQVNQPPAFTSQPNTEAIPGVPYVYQATASDTDGDKPLHFSVLTGPAGMTVDATTGQVTWSPQQSDLGTQAVLLRVDDGRGGLAQQQYTITVIAAPPNRPPVFTSTPVVDGNVNTPYSYQATATDPDGTKPTDPTGETLTYSVVSGPQGLSVNPSTGLVTWTPTVAQLGTDSVTLQVDDGRGGTATQSYTVAVQPQTGNVAPVFVSQPATTLELGQTYTDQARAVDADKDPLTYSLPAAPQGMNIDSGTGQITWTPPTAPGSALQFNGSGGYVSVGNRLNMGTSDFTLEAWIKGDPTMSDWGRIIDKGYASGYALGRFANTNRVSFEFLASGSQGSNFTTTRNVIDNTWHQITVVKSGNTASLYADGVLQNTETVSSAAQNNTLPLLIGYNPGEGGQSHWKGQIDDVHIWTVARTAQQIQSDMDFAVDPHTGGLAADWTLDEGQGTVAHDATGNGNNGTLTADGSGPTMPTWVASAAPIYASASAPVTVRVDDGRGGFDTQSYTIQLLPAAATGGIQGTKFNDLNANGVRDSIGGNDTPPPSPPVFNMKWVGSKSGNWDDPTNWLDTTTNAHRLPTASDNPVINVAGVTVTVEAGNQAAGSLEVAAGSTLAVAGGNLALGSQSEIDGSLSITAGNLRLVGDITVRGNTLWSNSDNSFVPGINLNGHTLQNSGVITMLTGSPNDLNLYANDFFTGAGDSNESGRLINSGTLVEKGTSRLLLWDSVGIENQAAGRIELASDAGIVTANGSPSLVNSGIVIKTGGTGTSTINLFPVNNVGILEADSGTLDLSNSQVTEINGNQLTGGIWAAHNAATLKFPGGTNITTNQTRLVLDGAGSTITGIQNLAANNGTLAIRNGASLTTPGDLSNSGGITLGSGGSLTVTGNYGQTAGGLLDIELGGTSSGKFGTLAVTKSTTLAGTFQTILVGGYTPAAGDQFTVATSASSSGSFSSIYVPQTATVAFQAGFNPTSIVLAARAAVATATSISVAATGPQVGPTGDLTLIATVKPVGGSTSTPTGSVQFEADGAVVGAPVALASDSAILNLNPGLGAGTHAITALYISDSASFANSDNTAAPLVQTVSPRTVSSIELFYTRFGGSPPVNDVSAAFDGTSIVLGTPKNIASGFSADGLAFAPNGDVIVGTQSNTIDEVNLKTGQVSSTNVGGNFDTEHVTIDPSGTKVWTGPQPGPLAEVPLNPLAPGKVDPLHGDDTNVTQLGFDQSGNAYYTASGGGGFGNFGVIDLTSFTTKRVFTNLPAAHGIFFDSYTGDLFIVGNNTIAQIDPQTLKIVSSRVIPNTTLDQGAADGNGHLYVADNGGHMVFVDYSASGLVGDPSDAVATPFLAGALDDFAPLSGAGALLEPGLAGWTIFLDLNHDGKLDPGDPFTTTDSVGHYAFTGLAPGTYTVAEVGQPGWRQTAPASLTWTVTVQAGHIVNSVDFGNTQKDTTPTPRPPQITSTAPTTATVHQPYRYVPTVSNPDGQPLTFDLSVAPAGMGVDPVTGTIVWTPSNSEVGSQLVLLRVKDDQGLVALEDIQVQVSAADTPPIIASIPQTPALAGLPYQYQVRAQDAENEIITFSLGSHPSGMAIDPATGLLIWTPDASLANTSQHVVVIAADPHAMTSQTFDLQVAAPGANDQPQITSSPRLTIALGHPYGYQVVASDADNDPLTYHLDTFPSGMAINSSGLVQWTPTASQFGRNQVVLHVDDGRGGTASQTFTITVASRDSNRPPVITSTPHPGDSVGHLYAYDIQAHDPDGDPIAFSLDQAPPGLSINPITGTVRWVPQEDQLGPNTVTVRVTDTFGAFTTQRFTVTVRGVEAPPLIISTPPTQAAIGQAYAYQVIASDVDGDPLTYSLVAPPTGMAIDPNSGLIQWTPLSGQLGSNSVTLQADDGQGGIAQQTYTVVVSSTPLNPRPIITSTPPLAATVAALYQYQVQAHDPDGETLHYALQNPSGNMHIDPLTGLLQWTPALAEVGTVAVAVTVTDTGGGTASQNYTVGVIRFNHPPVINSQPQVTTTAGIAYEYDVQATDADGDPLTYALTGNPPAGMTIDRLGRLTWQTGKGDVGNHSITVAVSDDHGATVPQSFTLNVQADTQAPQVTLQFSENPANLGDTVTVLASATDNVAVQTLNVTVGGTPLALDADGSGSLVVSQAGQFPVVATATDPSGNVGTATATLIVIDPHVTGAPTVAFTTPADGDVISAPTDVIGTASDPHLLFYTLEVAPVGSNNFTQIFRGTSSVTNGKLGSFDPTLLQNGSYELRLTATNTGDISNRIDETISVMGNLKLGNFTLSFTDLTIPISGIPITVTRTYDTLQASTSEDFGYGWRLDYRDTNLQVSVPPSGLEDVGVYSAFHDGTRVYITLPGGQREGFTFHPIQQAIIGFFYDPHFVADPGVTDTLTVQASPLGADSDGAFSSFGSGDPYNPAAPEFGGQYTVTTKEGTVYRIDANTGKLLSVTDSNGNSLTFTDAGVTSSTGAQITFTRDSQNRIVALTDPAAKQIKYQYDSQGNLTSVTDPLGDVTQLVYREDLPHYLDHVVDPLGRTGARTEYNAQGQLVQLINAAGKAVQLAYDTAHSIETTTDAMGNATTYEYDDRGNILTEVDALGGVTHRTYDDNNNQLTQTDPLGNTTTMTYDSLGDMLTLTDALGNTTRSTYNSIGLTLTTTDPLGNTYLDAYDSHGNLLSVTDAAGKVTTYGYDNTGNQTSATDPLGNVTRSAYDNQGQLTREINAQGNVTDFIYDASGNLLTTTTTVTRASGPQTAVTSATFDAAGRKTSTTDALGATSRMEYDAAGNLIATIDPMNRRTQYLYDDQNQLVQTVYPDGTSTGSQYDAAGRETATTDQLGRAITYRYDALGRLVQTTLPDGTTTKTTYDAAGRQTSTTDALDNNTTYEYDPDGHAIAMVDALGNTTTSTFDADGRQTSTTDALGHTTQYLYDSRGQQTRLLFADGTSTSTVYDALGRKIAQTDQAGLTTQYQYDSLGRMTAVIDALGHRTSYAYDEQDNLVRQTDANGNITQYEYDLAGERTRTTLPLGQHSTATYDSAGNLTSTTDYNGNTIRYEYDSNNRLVAKRYPDGTSVTFTYTKTGLRASATDGSGTTTYHYDSRDQLISRTDPDNVTISYTYDEAGNRTSVTTLAGKTSYRYDALGHMSTVTAPDGGVTRYTYDAADNLIKSDFPNGISETRSYDSLGRLISITDAGPNGVVSSYQYALGPTGIRTDVVEGSGRAVHYVYDKLYRLVTEAVSDPVNGTNTTSYTYDAVGNRLSRDDSSGGLTTYQYDANDRLTTETAGPNETRYTYDGNGNMLSVSTSAGDNASYHWNFENRLVGADVISSSVSHHATFSYDADGTRVASVEDGAETRYQVDASQSLAEVVAEYSAAGAVRASFVYGNRLISQDRQGTVSYYVVDGLGSTRALINSGGVVTDTYVYDAFGNTTRQTGTTANEFLFAGEELDPIVGLYYLRARYLDAGTGSFVSSDPLNGSSSLPQSLNKVVYAQGDPVNKVDPSGKDTILETLGAFFIQTEFVIGVAFATSPLITTGAITLIAGSVGVFGIYNVALFIKFFNANEGSLAYRFRRAADDLLSTYPWALHGQKDFFAAVPRQPRTLLRMYKQYLSANPNVPAELVATVLLTEMRNYNLFDTVGDWMYPRSHSIGIAQIRMETIRNHHYLDKMSDDALEAALWTPPLAIQILTLEIQYYAQKAGIMSKLQNWYSLPLEERRGIAAGMTLAKDTDYYVPETVHQYGGFAGWGGDSFDMIVNEGLLN
jgi:RHS repeat-associated protein